MHLTYEVLSMYTANFAKIKIMHNTTLRLKLFFLNIEDLNDLRKLMLSLKILKKIFFLSFIERNVTYMCIICTS